MALNRGTCNDPNSGPINRTHKGQSQPSHRRTLCVGRLLRLWGCQTRWRGHPKTHRDLHVHACRDGYIHAYVLTLLHAYIYIYIYRYLSICICVIHITFMYVCMHACMYAWMCIYIYMGMCVYVCVLSCGQCGVM